MQIAFKYLSVLIILSADSYQLSAQSADREVYLAALSYFYDEVVENIDGSCITISERYGEVPLVGSMIPYELEKQDSTMAKNFLANNGYSNEYVSIDKDKFSSYLHRQFDSTPYIHIISQEEALDLGKKPTRKSGFYERLFKKYPCSEGLLFLSYIGYNADGTEAIFYIENLFHYLAGGGFLAICKFTAGKWNVVAIKPVLEA